MNPNQPKNQMTEDQALWTNKNGEVTFHGGETIKIPKGMSALNMLAKNSVFAGEEFHPDGYVYQNGVRLRRWFKSLPTHRNARIWPGRYAQLSKVEASLERNRQRILQWCDKFWTEAKDRVKASNNGKPIYGWVSHREQWILLTPSTYMKEDAIRESELRIKDAKAWEERLREKVNGAKYDPATTNAYCQMATNKATRWRRLGLIYSLLDSILWNRFEDDLFKGRVIRLMVNGREYIFRLYDSEFDMELEWLARPGDMEPLVVHE